MKKIALLLLLSLNCSLYAQHVQFLKKNPELGNVIKFVYDPKGGNIAKLENINCWAKGILDRDKRVNLPVKLTKNGAVYEGELKPTDSIHLVVLIFGAGGNNDENPNGYFIKLCKGGVPTPMSIFLEGHLFSGFGNDLAKIKADQQRAIFGYQAAFKADEKLKDQYFENYLRAQYFLNKTVGEKLVKETITSQTKLAPSEANLTKLVNFYGIIKNQFAVDSVRRLIYARYPKGKLAFGVSMDSLRITKGAEAKEKKLKEILVKYDLDMEKAADAAQLSSAFMSLGVAFLSAKDYDKVEFYIDKIESKTTRAVLYNSFAWKNQDLKNNLPFFARISKKSLALVISAMSDEEPANYYHSKIQYMKVLRASRSQYELTYATILDLQGQYGEALDTIQNAVEREDFSAVETNAMFVRLLAKNGKTKEAVAYAERFIRDGQVSEALKNELKSIYTGLASFENYYAGLERDATVLRKERLIKQMIDVPAPKFVLNNMGGERVSLDQLKGKIVVIDYWATWCGPCLLSFPGMQMAIDKYKNDPNVAFLFINTWQREPNRLQALKDWAKTNTKFQFNILLDEPSKTLPEEFETVNQYKVTGLPTKFIVDAKGKIRFKVVGFDGDAKGVVQELDVMIGLLKDAQRSHNVK